MKIYYENFKDSKDVLKEFDAPKDALDGAKVLLAWYGYGSYSGKALVIFQKDGKLWEVNGLHCSCYGLEGNWEPEETSPEALLKRDLGDWSDGAEEVTAVLHRLAKRLAAK